MKSKRFIKKGLAIGSIFILLSIMCLPIKGMESQEIKEINKNPFQLNQGNTLYVGGNGPGNYTSIKEAVNDSTDDDTVFVYDDSSPYYEDKIQVCKSINLIGEDKETTIIEGGGFENIVIITSDNVTITGFTIQKSGADFIEWAEAGINNIGADNTRIYDNIIQNNRGEGICICGSQNCTIENNLIVENRLRGILIFKGSHNILVTHNTIRNNSKNAILGSGLNNLTVIENNIMFNGPVELIGTYESNINCNNFYGNRGEVIFTYHGYTGALDEKIFYWFEYLKERWKGRSLKFNANYWNKGRIIPFELDNGWIIIEGLFSYLWEEFRYSKYDWHPAIKPYKIAGWDISSIP